MSKVLYVVGTLASGGIERLVSDWCFYLKEKTSWTPVVVCIIRKQGQFVEPLSMAGITVVECSMRNGLPGFIRRFARLIRLHNPDVVHSQVAFSLLWQVIAYRLGGCKRIIFTQHNQYQNWNHFFAKRRLRIYFTLAKAWITFYTCVSTPVRDSLAALLSEPADRFRVIHNSFDPERFRPKPEVRLDLRKKWNWATHDFVFITVARFAEQKGHRFLIEAFVKLVAEFPAARLVLVGDGPLLPEVQLKVESANLSDRVQFVKKTNQVEDWLVAADSFVLPSLWEGMPLSLLEAMACKVPVIATAVSGNKEVLTPSTGTLVSPGNAEELYQGMRSHLLQADQAKANAETGFVEVNKRFSLPSVLSQYIALYQT